MNEIHVAKEGYDVLPCQRLKLLPGGTIFLLALVMFTWKDKF